MPQYWYSDLRESSKTVSCDQDLIWVNKLGLHSVFPESSVTRNGSSSTPPPSSQLPWQSNAAIASQQAVGSSAVVKRPRPDDSGDDGPVKKKVAHSVSMADGGNALQSRPEPVPEPRQVPGQVPEQVAAQLPGQVPAQVTAQLPGLVPAQVPAQVPGQVPGLVPDHVPASSGRQGPVAATSEPSLDRAREVIGNEFSTAILLKHEELRLIHLEMAKCQVALEQLRRCHLIPYPVNMPTPEQMLQVSYGTGPALGDDPPRWAPPFGVTDGPYARHYAKWLIPDPIFDGIEPDPAPLEYLRSRQPAEGRATRQSVAEVAAPPPRGRTGRAGSGHKVQAPGAQTQSKDKTAPVILRRAADGKMVKLVCLTCRRDNFSNTQGFINHCRIAHSVEYKSHEAAAVACGEILEMVDGVATTDDKSKHVPAAAAPTLGSRLVHPFARQSTLFDSEACFTVASRIAETLATYESGRPSGIPAQTRQPRSGDRVPSADSPYLSRLVRRVQDGPRLDFDELVRDAKIKVDLDNVDDDETMTGESDSENPPVPLYGDSSAMRKPIRTAISPAAPPAINTSWQDMETDPSPNTAISNNAPSLVSDDGESVDGSSDESDMNNGVDAVSVSQLGFDEDHANHRESISARAVHLRNGEPKHVTFVGPVQDNGQPDRGRVQDQAR